MANRGEIKLAYNRRRESLISKLAEMPTKTLQHVSARLFVRSTVDCVSEQSDDKKVISYYRENLLVGQVVWVEDETQFRLMM